MLNWTSESLVPMPGTNPKPKPKHSMLPAFVVLFLISYGLMALLVVEQGRTIENQRTLIQSLFSDSAQLNHLRTQVQQKQRAEAKAQADARAHSQVQTPSTQDKPQEPAKKNSGKVRKPLPQKPPTDANSLDDERRNVVRI